MWRRVCGDAFARRFSGGRRGSRGLVLVWVPLRALAASFYQGPLLVNGDDGDDGGSDDGIHGANANDHAD